MARKKRAKEIMMAWKRRDDGADEACGGNDVGMKKKRRWRGRSAWKR